MNPIELDAYRMVLREGTNDEVGETLKAIAENETEIGDELMDAIIAMFKARAHNRGFLYQLFHLLGRTRSMELFRVADEKGYFEWYQVELGYFLNGKISLFVRELFNCPDLEAIVIRELFHLFDRLDKQVGREYARALGRAEEPEPPRPRKESFYSIPQMQIAHILEAFEEIGSEEGRKQLLALEYIYRPRCNEYMAIEYQRVSAGDPQAVDPHFELGFGVLSSATVYHYKELLDLMHRIAHAKPGEIQVFDCGRHDRSRFPSRQE